MYFTLNVQLQFKVSDEARKTMRLFHTTVFAGCLKGSLLLLAMECCVIMGIPVPQVIILLRMSVVARVCLRRPLLSRPLSPPLYLLREKDVSRNLCFLEICAS